MRYTGPKNRLARREGIDLGLKTPGSKSYSNLTRKLNVIPGQHSDKYRKKLTDYGIQLREKQKLKRLYGITEKQMKKYFREANRKLGNTAEILIQMLEQRLDNVVYRLALAPTRSSARQLVTHGHIKVNQQRVNIPSYLVKIGDIISFSQDKTLKIPYINQILEKKDIIIPNWLARQGPAGKVLRVPKREDVKEDIDLQQVIEFYSR